MTNLNQVYDVLVVGGGNAALCAAIASREAGATVLVLEHAPKEFRGGNSRHTRNLRAMHLKPTSTLTDSYSESDYWKDLLSVTGGKTDEHLARIAIRGTSEVLPWMEAHGVHFQPSLSGTLNLSRTNAFFLGGGKALMNAYYATAERIGIKVAYNTEVKSLRLVDGAVQEAMAISEGSPVTVRARSIVVASGGFQANIEWLREYWGDAADNFLIRGTPFDKGVILRNLLDQGVAPIGDPKQCHAVAIDARAPKFDGGIVTRLDCIPFSIVVDHEARRFYNEGEDLWPKRYAIWGRLVALRPKQIAYAILDAKSETLFMPSVFPGHPRKQRSASWPRNLGLMPGRWKQRSGISIVPCNPAHSIVVHSMIAGPPGLIRRKRIGRARSTPRLSSVIRCGQESHLPISA